MGFPKTKKYQPKNKISGEERMKDLSEAANKKGRSTPIKKVITEEAKAYKAWKAAMEKLEKTRAKFK